MPIMRSFCFFKLSWPAAVLLLAVGCHTDRSTPEKPAEAGPGPDAAAVSWMRQSLLPVRSTEPGGDAGDLAPLLDKARGTRVVALGEATHGTHEFFRMKHRIFQSLVDERGFDLFVLEAGGPEMDRLDDFVTSGTGDPERLLTDLGYWPWRARELASLFRWIRQHNLQHNQTAGEKPVRVAGIDMQDPRAASAEVLAFLHAVDPAAQQQADTALACLRPFATPADINALYRGYLQRPPEQQSACRAGLQSLSDRILALRGKAAAGEGMRAMADARTLVQFEQILRFRGLRDRFMADNLTWLLEQRYPGSRAALWSHNAHVMRQPGRLGGALERRLGNQAVLHLGFTFYSGAFNAVEQKENGPFGGLRTFQAEPPPADSWETLLHTTGLPRGLLDLGAGAGPVPSWIDRPHPLRRIGASYGGDPQASRALADLRRELDFLVYVEQTTPSDLLPSDHPGSP